jgi:hypothetical protein
MKGLTPYDLIIATNIYNETPVNVNVSVSLGGRKGLLFSPSWKMAKKIFSLSKLYPMIPFAIT